jgi:hypothetical protein
MERLLSGEKVIALMALINVPFAGVYLCGVGSDYGWANVAAVCFISVLYWSTTEKQGE